MTYTTVLEAIKANGRLSTEAAEAVFALYRTRKIRAIAWKGAHDGFVIADGAFLDYDVIRRAHGVLVETDALASSLTEAR